MCPIPDLDDRFVGNGSEFKLGAVPVSLERILINVHPGASTGPCVGVARPSLRWF